MVCGEEMECQIVDGVDLPSQKPLFNTLSPVGFQNIFVGHKWLKKHKKPLEKTRVVGDAAEMEDATDVSCPITCVFRLNNV